ncbi:MAG: branched-chain amino acid ABC transporter permease [Bacillota bacterium]|nr:branched-chain amino acid ABC transporter permease [Bacillota bacterium]
MNRVALTSKKFLLPGLMIIALILLVTSPSYISAYKVMLLTSILMYIVVSVSWAIFSGPTGYISLASAAFFGVGIYTAAILGRILPLTYVIIIGGLVSVVLALIVGVITLRLKGMYFAIFTFGLVELLKHFLLWWEINITGTRGRFVISVHSETVFYVMIIIFVAVLLTAYLIKHSKYGLALQSIGEYEEAAEHIGINVTMVKIATFAISSFFIGSAGAIIATRWTYVDPYIAFNPIFSFMPVLMSIFGGLGQLFGPVLGAAFFAYLEESLITKFPYHYMLIFGIILVVAILYLPDGLIGLAKKWKKGSLSSGLVELLQKRQKGRKEV